MTLQAPEQAGTPSQLSPKSRSTARSPQNGAGRHRVVQSSAAAIVGENSRPETPLEDPLATEAQRTAHALGSERLRAGGGELPSISRTLAASELGVNGFSMQARAAP